MSRTGSLIPQQIDLLFASKTPFVWETEKRFQELKLQHTDLVHGIDHRRKVQDVSDEAAVKSATVVEGAESKETAV